MNESNSELDCPFIDNTTPSSLMIYLHYQFCFVTFDNKVAGSGRNAGKNISLGKYPKC